MDLRFSLALLDIAGVLAFALSGALMGMKKHFDMLGMFALAVITAFSGGIVRALLLGETPFAFLMDVAYLLGAILATLIVFSLRQQMYRFTSFIKIFDAIGLGIFFSSGMTMSLQQHGGFIPSIVLGAITAICGGIIRDVLAGEMPLLFRKELYLLICISGGLFYFLLYLFPIPRDYIVISTALFVATFRILALQRNWSLSR